MKSKWKDAPLLYKIVSIISTIAGIAVVALAVLQILDIWDQAIDIIVPLMGTMMLCQAYTLWNSSRKVAYLSIGAAALVFICVIAVLFIK